MSTALETQTTTKLKAPSLYKVVLLNDDFTPFDFVIRVLGEIFDKTYAEADVIAQQIHSQGKGVVGTYTKEVADQKVYETSSAAKRFGHPLAAKVELA